VAFGLLLFSAAAARATVFALEAALVREGISTERGQISAYGPQQQRMASASRARHSSGSRNGLQLKQCLSPPNGQPGSE
jgi:hypothetical protein